MPTPELKSLELHDAFSVLNQDLFKQVLEKLELVSFAPGQVITSANSDSALYGIIAGAVDVKDAEGRLLARLAATDFFGYEQLLNLSTLSPWVEGFESGQLFKLSKANFEALLKAQPSFADYFRKLHMRSVSDAVKQLQASDSGTQLLTMQVKDLIKRAPVQIDPESSIREAAEVMTYARISSLLVMKNDYLLGIVTDRDLRGKVIAKGLSSEESIASIMTENPICLAAESFAFELILTMTKHKIHHMPIVEGKKIIGMLTTTDLLRMQSANPVFLVGEIAKQTTVEGVALLAQRLVDVVRQLVDADATAYDIGRIITSMGDSIEKQLLTIAEEALGEPPIAYLWLVLGSQARLEQTAHSMQKNALLLSNDFQDEHDSYFSKLARFVSDGLYACGFKYCNDNLMATNTSWRQPLNAWQSMVDTQMSSSAASNTPLATLNDLRPLHGDTELMHKLHINPSQNESSKKYLQQLTKEALEHKPPLGFFRQFVVETSGSQSEFLNLKTRGILPIVELARVYAFELQSPELNTRERLSQAQEAGLMSSEDARNLKDALEYISYLRIRHQGRQVRARQALDNKLSPSELSSFEREHLKDAFKLVSQAQAKLAQRHGLRFFR